MSITHLTTLDQLNQLISKHQNSVILIDFHAQWCGPCHAIADFYQSLASSYPSITFTKCDVDQAQELSKHFQITAMPTFLFLKSGTKVDQIRGADRSTLEKLVKKYAATSSQQSSSSSQHHWTGPGHRLGSKTTTTSSSSSTPLESSTNSINHDHRQSNPSHHLISLSFDSLRFNFNQLSFQTKLGIGLVLGYLLLVYLS